MPPKGGRGAPKPAEFHVSHLRAGRKQWVAGGTGPHVLLSCARFGQAESIPRRETLLSGKALFGRDRLAFEVQELDHSPASVKRLLKKEKELRDRRFGGTFGSDASEEEAPRQKKDVDFFEAFRAAELAAKYSIQVKFADIKHIEATPDSVTLTLSSVPACYVKPEGEPPVVNMEVAKDITGSAKTVTFGIGAPAAGGLQSPWAKEVKALPFSAVREQLVQHSPRMAALLEGRVPPEPETPTKPKRKIEEKTSAVKQPRRSGSPPEEIKAADGTWLRLAVDRFGLKGTLDAEVTDGQWKAYMQARVLLELGEAASLQGEDEEHESTFAASSWPEVLGPKPTVPLLGFESYKDEPEEREFAAGIIAQIRKSVMATVASSALQLDAASVARGVFLTSYHINDDEGEPRTVTACARIYAPNGTGRFLDLDYENHHRERMSFTERHSYLYATRSGKEEREKIFELDFDENRRKNPTKTSLASGASLASLGAHLFGEQPASNRKVFGLLVRAAGLGKYGEHNGWPIAVARRRFKCGKGEGETDTEKIAGERSEDPGVGGCAQM